MFFLYDVIGNLVFDRTLSANDISIKINMNYLSKGVYIFKLNFKDNTSYSNKIIIN